MPIEKTRATLCKVSAQEELSILRDARLDAQRIIGRLGLLYGREVWGGPEQKAVAAVLNLRQHLTDLIGTVTGVIDDQAATNDLFAQPTTQEKEAD